MEQTVAHARMEQQLYGGAGRGRDDEQRVVSGKQRALQLWGSSGAGGSGSAAGGGGAARRGSRSDDGSDGGRRGSKPGERQGLRGLFFNILRSRFDSGGSSSGGGAGPGGASGGDRGGSGTSAAASAAEHFGVGPSGSLEGHLVRREGSMHLPRPADCQMPGTHSDMCIVRVRRNHLVEDALDEIARQFRRDLFKPLRVHFIGEEGIDAGGVKKEFFQLLVAELLSPDYGMLVYQPESHTYWFNACSLVRTVYGLCCWTVLSDCVPCLLLLMFAFDERQRHPDHPRHLLKPHPTPPAPRPTPPHHACMHAYQQCRRRRSSSCCSASCSASRSTTACCSTSHCPWRSTRSCCSR